MLDEIEFFKSITPAQHAAFAAMCEEMCEGASVDVTRASGEVYAQCQRFYMAADPLVARVAVCNSRTAAAFVGEFAIMYGVSEQEIRRFLQEV